MVLAYNIPLAFKHSLGGEAERGMIFELGVGFKVFLGFCECGGHKVAILAHIGEVECEATALADACVTCERQEVTGTAQFKVFLGDLKAVIAIAHCSESLLRVLAKSALGTAYKYTEGFFLSASNTTSELV